MPHSQSLASQLPQEALSLTSPLWEKACPHSQSLASQLPQEAFSFTSHCGRRLAHTANRWQASSHKKLSASQVSLWEKACPHSQSLASQLLQKAFSFTSPLWEKAWPHSQSLASQLPQEAFSLTSPCGRRLAHTANRWQASSHKKLSVSQVSVGAGLPAQPIAGKPAPTKSSQLHKPLCGSWLASDAGDAVLLLAPYRQSRASQTRP